MLRSSNFFFGQRDFATFGHQGPYTAAQSKSVSLGFLRRKVARPNVNHSGEMPEGTLRAILKQAGIEPDDFLRG
jgi:hypothetical protein